MISISKNLVLFVIGHYAADYIQTGFTAKFKAPNSCAGWQHILLGHASLQAVAIIVSMVFLGHSRNKAIAFGATEMVLHSAIDTAKGHEKITLNQDQWLHIICKALYVALLFADGRKVKASE